MSTAISIGGKTLQLPDEGESYSLPVLVQNFTNIADEVNLMLKAKSAQFNMISARGSTPGAGVNWGHLQIDTARGYSHAYNNFCVVANEGTAGTGGEKGRIRITKEGIYDLYAQYTCTASPGALNFAMIVDKVEGGSDKIPMGRDSTYGDWEAHVSKNGVLLKVGDHVSGYQANGNGVAWAMGMTIVRVGDNG